MSYTAEQIAALKAAIAAGTTRVSYDGRTVEYRSFKEMREILAMMEAEVSGNRPRRTLAVYRSGV